MYGAILGDMIGAPYEFDRGNKTKVFPLFGPASHFTDDSVMTIAVAEALLDSRGKEDEDVRSALVGSMRKWGKRYPGAGYGRKFYHWLWSGDPKPYGSCGNGSAMRASAAGWLFDTLEQTRHMARLTAEVTHNHPEGIKGAEATASAIFLARTGSGKGEIRDYIVKEFDYDLSRSCDEIRPEYHHVETCQKTVPEAITAFLEGTDFEDVIRTAVSLGGDCDTLTCIAGSIAEAFYGVPDDLAAECRSRIPEDMLSVVDRFDLSRRPGRDPSPGDPLSGNTVIDEAIGLYHQDSTKENLSRVLHAVLIRMQAGGHFLIPVLPAEAAPDGEDPAPGMTGGSALPGEDRSLRLNRVRSGDGKLWPVVFTSRAEYEKGENARLISHSIRPLLEGCSGMPEGGLVINPWGQSFLLTKELIQMILRTDKEGSAQ